MTTISSLNHSLSQAISNLIRDYGNLGNTEPIKKEIELIEKHLGSGISQTIPEEKIAKAITLFNKTNKIVNKGHAYLLCWGLVTKLENSPILIEDERCSLCLKEISSSFNNEALSSLAWRGLLNSYFIYSWNLSKSEIGRKNWMQLRKFLSSSLQSLYDKKTNKPLWLNTLNQNKNLLEDDPIAIYLDSALEGDLQELNQIIDTLTIPKTSWFIEEIVLGQIYKVCDFNDDNFKKYLPNMLQLLSEHELFIDKGLANLLDRYQECNNNLEDKELSKFALDHWNNPKLSRKNAKWGLVKQVTKAMFLKWLTEKDIRAFFNVFKDDGTADIRRMNFWLKYVDGIKDAYFSLGSHLRYSRDKELLELIGRNEGRTSRLEGNNMELNCAFIMIFENHLIIEYGLPNNACYCFSMDSLPFDLESRVLIGTGQELKDRDFAVQPFPLNHVETNRWGNWENRFEHELGRLGIKQDKPTNQIIPNYTPQTKVSVKAKKILNDRDLVDFIQKHNLRMDDNREKGGALWIYAGNANHIINSTLEEFGFTFKSDRGWWYN